MAYAYEIPITLAGNRRVDASLHGHLVCTDQPIAKGGEDRAPSPYDLFLASIGTCAGIIVQGFCAKRAIPFEDIAIVEEVAFDDDGILTEVAVDVRLPKSFPERYVTALHRAIEQCPVARSILAQPRFTVTAHLGEVVRSSTGANA